MVKATEYRFDAQASETAELLPAARGVCSQDAMFRQIRYARPQSNWTLSFSPAQSNRFAKSFR